jgi:hypothetical protein
MQWLRSKVDPTLDPAAAEAVEAFQTAEKAGLSTCDCYRASVEAWRRAHPDHAPGYASMQAVEVVLKARVSLRVPD